MDCFVNSSQTGVCGRDTWEGDERQMDILNVSQGKFIRKENT